MALITVQQAATTLGVSTASVYKELKAGRLPLRRVGKRLMIERDGLSARWHGSSQRRVVVSVEPGPNWQQIAAKLNRYLGPTWPAPPWDGDQANTLAMCLSLAYDDD
jgi:excisionase family DNA binding protein